MVASRDATAALTHRLALYSQVCIAATFLCTGLAMRSLVPTSFLFARFHFGWTPSRFISAKWTSWPADTPRCSVSPAADLLACTDSFPRQHSTHITHFAHESLPKICNIKPVVEANRHWSCKFCYSGSQRETAVAQLFSLGSYELRHNIRC